MQIDPATLTRLRETYPLSKAELAEKAGIQRYTLRMLEAGTVASPRPATIRKLAAALGVSPQQLLRETAA